MVESNNSNSKPNPNEFDKYIIITIRNKDYGNRKKIVKQRQKIDGIWTSQPKLDQHGEPVLAPINIDLPYTVSDEEEFHDLLKSLNI